MRHRSEILPKVHLLCLSCGVKEDLCEKEVSSEFAGDPVPKLEFQGPMVPSGHLQLSKLKPSYKNDFKFIKQLGWGASGVVYQCTYQLDSCEYAVKIIDLKKAGININEPREVAVLSRLQHPHIVRFGQAWTETGIFYECGTNDEYDSDGCSNAVGTNNQESLHLFIQMEYCPSTVGDLIKPGKHKLNMAKAWSLFEEIVRGVNFMHEAGVIHRDLKPVNIFFGSNDHIKIGDFGHALFGPGESGELVGGTPDRGTLFYDAPELERNEKINEKVDIYSLGVIFFEIFYPVDWASKRNECLRKLRRGIIPEDWRGDAELLKKLIERKHFKRPSTVDILDYLDTVEKRLGFRSELGPWSLKG